MHEHSPQRIRYLSPGTASVLRARIAGIPLLTLFAFLVIGLLDAAAGGQVDALLLVVLLAFWGAPFVYSATGAALELTFDGATLSWRTVLASGSAPIADVASVDTRPVLDVWVWRRFGLTADTVVLRDGRSIAVASGVGLEEFFSAIRQVRPELPVALTEESKRRPNWFRRSGFSSS